MAGPNNKLVDQSEALDSFFESLMRDVEAYAESEQEDSSQAEPAAVSDPDAFRKKGKRVFEAKSQQQNEVTVQPRAQSQLSDPEIETPKPVTDAEPDNTLFAVLPAVKPAEPDIEQQVEAVTPVEIKSEPEAKVTEPVVEVAKQPEPDTKTEIKTGRPEWGEAEFQAMLFKVAGLTLAVPLVDLNGVVECNLDDVTEMPGHADFYLGLLGHLGKSVPLVDTARFVLPPNKLQLLAGDDPKARITRAVMIQDCQYALGCDEVNEVLTLRPDEVRWRTTRTSRRWLAGTVIEHMCALIDATAFAELLAQRASPQAFRE